MLRERRARQNKRDSRLARDNGQPFTIRVNLKVRYRNFQLQTEAPNSLFPHSNGSPQLIIFTFKRKQVFEQCAAMILSILSRTPAYDYR